MDPELMNSIVKYEQTVRLRNAALRLAAKEASDEPAERSQTAPKRRTVSVFTVLVRLFSTQPFGRPLSVAGGFREQCCD